MFHEWSCKITTQWSLGPLRQNPWNLFNLWQQTQKITSTQFYRPKSIKQNKNWRLFIFIYHFEWIAEVKSERWRQHTEHERLKHVANDSRLDLSFIIVFDTCRRHRPLFCRLHNNNRLWHVSEPDSCAVCFVKCTKANKSDRKQHFCEPRKVIHHGGINTYSIFLLANMIN